MNAKNKENEDQISMITISDKLRVVLDQLEVITAEIAEMKEREGGKYGDH